MRTPWSLNATSWFTCVAAVLAVHVAHWSSQQHVWHTVVSRYALGGSTNAVLHLLALAHEAEVDIVIDDFNRIGEKVPLVGKTLL